MKNNGYRKVRKISIESLGRKISMEICDRKVSAQTCDKCCTFDRRISV